MRSVWFFAALAGCRFVPGLLPDHGDAALDATGDADAIDARPLDASVDGPRPYCDPDDPDVIACYPFEGSGQNAAGTTLHATTSNVSYVAGKVGMAMQFGSNSAAEVGEDPLLDPTTLTIEAWIRPSTIPSSGRMGIVDNNGQWGLFVHPGGNLRCTMTQQANQTSGTIVANEWNHVACTHDGTTTRLYAHGVLVAEETNGTNLGSSGTTGMSIAADNPPGSGSRLDGVIDELRLLRGARSGLDICRDAERETCP
jgi:hypothetical protein